MVDIALLKKYIYKDDTSSLEAFKRIREIRINPFIT